MKTTLNKEETIIRLCALVSSVGECLTNSTVPHDCFCGESSHIITPVVSEEIIDFIEAAVSESLTANAE